MKIADRSRKLAVARVQEELAEVEVKRWEKIASWELEMFAVVSDSTAVCLSGARLTLAKATKLVVALLPY